MRLKEATARIERAMDEYTEALFQETRLRLRKLQMNFFPKSVVEFKDLGYRDPCVETMIDGENARDVWCKSTTDDEKPGFRAAVELEDWHEDQATEWNIRIEDIRLEARQ